MYSNISDIIESYRKDNLPYFLILCGKQILERHEEIDIDDGVEKLESGLKRAGAQKVVVNIYKTIGKTGGITDKSDIYKVYPFQVQYSMEEKNEYYNRSGIGAAMIAEIRDVKRDLIDIKTKIETEEEDEEDIKNQMEPANNGVIGMILGNPAVQSFLTNFLTNITANIVNRPMNRHQPIALSGDDHAAIVQSCINELINKGMTVGDLQKLASMDLSQISFLLNMLRNQQ